MTLRCLLLLEVACALLMGVHLGRAQDVPEERAAAPEPPQAHEHWGLKFTEPVETGPPGDPRLKPEVRYAPVGDDAMIEGDIVIGKVAPIRRGRFYALVEEAKMTASEDKLDLTPEERAVLARLRSLTFPADYLADARVRHTDRAKRILATLVAGEAAFQAMEGFPALEIQRLKQVQARAEDAGGVPAYALVQADARYRWPNGVVPYVIDPSTPNQPIVRQAIDHWHARTDRIHLRPWQQGDTYYARFVGGSGCSSYIGRVAAGQPITLAVGCQLPQIIHEIGHCVGLWHEQCRNDRDRYLAILEQNIAPQMLYNFDQAGAPGRDVGLFDYRSIMLYSRTAFTANGKPTMLSRRPEQSGAQWGIPSPSVDSLSQGDLAGVAVMYPAPANPPNPMHR